MLGNITSSCFPGRCHGLLTHNCLLANGATVVEACELAKAVCVNGVSTGQILRRLATAKHVFATNGTVVLVLVLEALVRLKDRDGYAHATLVAVAKSFHSTHTAETTLYTMEGFFGLEIYE